jgi:hypothetical protein
MYDFESYKTTATSSLYSFIYNAGDKPFEVKGVPPKEQRLADREEENSLLAEQIRLESSHNKLKTGKGYTWGPADFIQAPFALIVGSLNALGTASSASYCSRYTLSSRQYI